MNKVSETIKDNLFKKRKLINNIWFYMMLFGLIVVISMIAICFSDSYFESIRNFWGFWLIWSLFLAIFIFGAVMFIRNIIKIKSNNQTLMNKSLMSDFKEYKKMFSNKDKKLK